VFLLLSHGLGCDLKFLCVGSLLLLCSLCTESGVTANSYCMGGFFYGASELFIFIIIFIYFLSGIVSAGFTTDS
jgi:hypothetical protein